MWHQQACDLARISTSGPDFGYPLIKDAGTNEAATGAQGAYAMELLETSLASPSSQSRQTAAARSAQCLSGLVPIGSRSHEGAVDVDHVDGELAQVGQGGVPSAEVVDGDADAQGLESGHPGHGLLDVGQQHVLGDLEQEAPGFEI